MAQIDLLRRSFRENLQPQLAREFPEVFPRIAAGIAGRGSECFGFDDEISRDHDFSGGIYLWITPEDDRKYGFGLMRCYDRWLKSDPSVITSPVSRDGGGKRGVTVIGDFFRRHLGFEGVPETWQQWLYTPEYAFAEVLNGEVFMDEAGIFTGIRQRIASGMPEDVRRKKLAFHAVMAAQSGQYNYSRCLKHGESGAAALALSDFVRHAAALICLLNYRFAPYYKWMFRMMRQLPLLGGLEAGLDRLLTDGTLSADDKSAMVEDISAAIAGELISGNWSDASGNYLEDHAYAVFDGIKNREIRALHIMDN